MPVRLNLHGTRVTTSSRYDRVRRGHMQDGVGIGGGKSEISVILLYVCIFCLCRWSLGPALFVAWIGGSVLIAGGFQSSLAFRERVKGGKVW